MVLFVNTVTHREGCRAVSSRLATEAYPQWYGAGSGTMMRPSYGTQMPPYLRIGPLSLVVKADEFSGIQAVTP
jgi:hypothetical protein